MGNVYSMKPTWSARNAINAATFSAINTPSQSVYFSSLNTSHVTSMLRHISKNIHSSDDLMILGFQVLTFKTLKSRGMTLPRLQQSQIISETPSSNNFYTPLRNAFPKFKAFFVQFNSRKERKSQNKRKKITKLKSFDIRR